MHISNYPLTILLYKYGHPYLTYLPQKFLSKRFLWKKFGSEISYLPTIWTYVQNFEVYFWNGLLRQFLENDFFFYADILFGGGQLPKEQINISMQCAMAKEPTFNV